MPDLPPPGPDLTQEAFAAALVAGVRRIHPDVAVSRRGHAIVFRRGSASVLLTGWVVSVEGAQSRTIMVLSDRHDAFVAGNAAVTIASSLG